MTISPRRASALMVFIIGATAGCASESDDPLAELKSAEGFILYSILSGGPLPPGVQVPDERFRNYPVLGKTDIADVDTRKRIVGVLEQSVRPADAMLPKCFEPRHAIRATQSGRSVDYLICFECKQIRKYGRMSYVTLSTSDAPQKWLNVPLRKAGIPLDPGMKGEI